MCGFTDRKYTYAELRDYSAAFAVRLQMQFHMKRNDVVAVCLPNIPEFPIVTLGAFEAGLVATTINPIYTAGKELKSLFISFALLLNNLSSFSSDRRNLPANLGQ